MSEEARKTREMHLGVLLNSDVKVWRYMDFAKFVLLLETESLHFCRSDLFTDPYEGSITKSAAAFRDAAWREHMKSIPDESFKQFTELHRFKLKEERLRFYINCWHMNEHESAAMWELYGIRGQSIAIQSSYRTLRETCPINQSSHGSPGDSHVDIGIVQYLDYDSDPMPQIYTFDPFLRKRKSFEHERELRLFYQSSGKNGSYEKRADGEFEFIPSDGVPEHHELGINIKVDLNKLIHNIYVSPDSAGWFKKLIDSVIKRYGLFIESRQSSLKDSPVY